MISINGAITAPLTANSDAGIIFTNTTFATLSKAAGSQYAIDLTGNGGRVIRNDGEIFGSIRLGNGWDTVENSGIIQGQINTGNGNDILTNQSIPGIDDGPQTAGTITGGVNMGNGDDTVLNTGTMANINLGSGNDTYTVGGFGGINEVVVVEDSDLFFPFRGDRDGGTGSAGDVRGGSGNDTMTGGTSDDKFFGGADDDRLLGNGGRDVLNGQNGNDALFGGAGNDVMAGGSGNDFMDGGGNGDDRMNGGTGHDRLNGGSGNDTLEGGQGRDLLIGGSGADVFVFSGNTGRDEIRDFSAGDRIDLQVFFADGFLTYDDIMDNTVFTGGDAVIELSSIFNNVSFGEFVDNGSVLTVNNVTIADLGESAFGFLDDIFVVG